MNLYWEAHFKKPDLPEAERFISISDAVHADTLSRLLHAIQRNPRYCTLYGQNVGLEALTTHIRRQLEKRGFCVVFETDLERCWPSEKIASTERERKIQAFAESQGAAVILAAESGARAIFRTRQPSPDLQSPCNYVSSEMQIWTLDMPK